MILEQIMEEAAKDPREVETTSITANSSIVDKKRIVEQDRCTRFGHTPDQLVVANCKCHESLKTSVNRKVPQNRRK